MNRRTKFFREEPESSLLSSFTSTFLRSGASSFAQLCQTPCDPWTVALAGQAPLSTGLPRQEHWSGLPCPSPGGLPDPGIEPASLASPALAGGFFTVIAA